MLEDRMDSCDERSCSIDIKSQDSTVQQPDDDPEVIPIELSKPGPLGIQLVFSPDVPSAVVACVEPGTQAHHAGIETGDVLCLSGSDGHEEILYDVFHFMARSNERPILCEVRRMSAQTEHYPAARQEHPEQQSAASSVSTEASSSSSGRAESTTKEPHTVLTGASFPQQDQVLIAIVLYEPGPLGIRLKEGPAITSTIVASVVDNSEAQNIGLKRDDVLCFADTGGKEEISKEIFRDMINSHERPFRFDIRRMPDTVLAATESHGNYIVHIVLPEAGPLGIRLEEEPYIPLAAIVKDVVPESQAQRAGLERGDIFCIAGSNHNGCGTVVRIRHTVIRDMALSSQRPVSFDVLRDMTEQTTVPTVATTRPSIGSTVTRRIEPEAERLRRVQVLAGGMAISVAFIYIILFA